MTFGPPLLTSTLRCLGQRRMRVTQIESGSPAAGASAPQAVLRRSTEDRMMWPLALVIAGAGLIFLGRGHDNT